MASVLPDRIRPEERVRVVIGDEVVPEDQWPSRIPGAADVVHVRVVPRLDDVFDLFGLLQGVSDFVSAFIGPAVQTLLQVGLATVGPSLQLALTGYSIYSAFRSNTAGQRSARLAGGSIVGGSRESGGGGRPGSDSPTISGIGNSEHAYKPVWRPFGKVKLFPGIVGRQYTEVIGGKVWLRVLFGFYGPCKITELKLGETNLIQSGADPDINRVVELNVGGEEDSEFGKVEYEIHEGWSDDADQELYPSKVTQEDLQITLHSNRPSGGQGFQIRTSATNAAEISLEIVFPGGFQVYPRDSNEEELKKMKFEFDFRETGTADPWDAPSKSDFRLENKKGARKTGNGKFEVDSKQKGQFFVGVRFSTPDPTKQYDVRLRARDAGGAGGPFLGQVVWVSLTTFEEGPIVNRDEVPNWCLIGLRMKATNKLAGQIESFNCLTESYLPSRTAGGWSGVYPPTVAQKGGGWKLTRNPTWAFTHVLRGTEQGEEVADQFIDGDGLLAWADANALEGATFDGVVDFASTTWELLSDIAATARATPHISGEWKVGVVYERDTRAEGITALITPRNTLRQRFSGELDFVEKPDAARVRFVSALRNYEFDEIVVEHPTLVGAPQKFEEDEIWGVTDADLVWKRTRRKMADAEFRRELWSVEMDVEYLSLVRGDLVGLSHDVPLLGLHYGRVKDATDDWIELDEEVVFQHGTSYAVTIRGLDGAIIGTAALTNPAPVAGSKTIGPNGATDADRRLFFVTPLTGPPGGFATFAEWLAECVTTFGEDRIGVPSVHRPLDRAPGRRRAAGDHQPDPGGRGQRLALGGRNAASLRPRHHVPAERRALASEDRENPERHGHRRDRGRDPGRAGRLDPAGLLRSALASQRRRARLRAGLGGAPGRGRRRLRRDPDLRCGRRELLRRPGARDRREPRLPEPLEQRDHGPPLRRAA